MTDKTVLNMLLGGAPALTGARFRYSGLKSNVNDTSVDADWSIESDWSGIILGRGIIGLLYYFYVFFVIFKNQKDTKVIALCLTILFAGIGYYYDTAIFINYILFFAASFHINFKKNKIVC
ncbi:hypothetical protein FACS1894110_22880 [Spirochaetia bacterium]|nr:hypothetical protein FACS1894110_22880 [Spirochaetia bacterium]